MILFYLIILLLVINILMTSYVLWIKPGKYLHEGGMRDEMGIHPIERELEMSDEQIEQHRSLIREHRSVDQEIDERIADVRKELYDSWEFSSQRVDSLSLILSEAYRLKELALIGHLQKVSTILDDTQKQRFTKLTQEAVSRQRLNRPPPKNPPPPR